MLTLIANIFLSYKWIYKFSKNKFDYNDFITMKSLGSKNIEKTQSKLQTSKLTCQPINSDKTWNIAWNAIRIDHLNSKVTPLFGVTMISR